MNAHYMNKKLKRFSTKILSHKRDDLLLGFMIGFTVVLSVVCYFSSPEGPQGVLKPASLYSNITNPKLLELHEERTIGIGQLDEDGWWNFDKIDIFKTIDDSIIFEKHAEITINSFPSDGEFRILDDTLVQQNKSLKIENEKGKIVIKGTTSQVEVALA